MDSYRAPTLTALHRADGDRGDEADGDRGAMGREDLRSPGRRESVDGFLLVATSLAQNQGLARSPPTGDPLTCFQQNTLLTLGTAEA